MLQPGKTNEDARRVAMAANIRWIAITSVSAIVLLTFLLGVRFAALPILYTLAVSIILNYLMVLALREHPEICRAPFFNYFTFLADLIFVTFLVHFTGGIESPFIMLYLLFPTVAALFYDPSFAIFIAGHAVVLFAGTARLESLDLLRHYSITSPTTILFQDTRLLFLYVASFFFILLAMIYAVSYLADIFREKQREIERLSGEKIDFMNNVAHELRTPLTSIKEYISLFIDGMLGDVPANQKEILDVVDRQSKRMVSMISDLLNLSRIESGKAKLEMKEINILKLIDGAVTDLLPQFIERKLKLVQQLETDIPPILADEIKIFEVLINLLSNAIKFSNEHGKIYLTLKKSPKQITVSIEDEGQGIEPQDTPHIFEKFYRAQKETHRPKGTGLGLALSRNIIESHGGKIWAESPGLGRGSTFRFTLPVK